MILGNMFSVAHVYADAIFGVSVDQGKMDQWQSHLELFEKVSKNSHIRSLFYRFIDAEKLFNIFIAVCEDIKCEVIDIFFRNTVRIIIDNNRLLLFPEILKEFNCFRALYMNTENVKVISAFPICAQQIKKISDLLMYRLSKKVNITYKIDKNLLAGIIICIGDIIIDGSIRGRLLRLENILQC